MRCRRPTATVFCLSSLGLLLLPIGAASLMGSAARAQGPRDLFPPSYYGYNLDDPHPGYFGGGRYNEYYKFGRGYWLANYPDSVPWFPPYRPWIQWQATPPPEALQQQIVLPDTECCHIGLRVPDDAEVFIEGKKTTQTGMVREFVSPPLAPGEMYLYTFRARWKNKGKTVEQSQHVQVRSGSRAEIVFPVPLPTESLPAPRPLPPALD